MWSRRNPGVLPGFGRGAADKLVSHRNRRNKRPHLAPDAVCDIGGLPYETFRHLCLRPHQLRRVFRHLSLCRRLIGNFWVPKSIDSPRDVDLRRRAGGESRPARPVRHPAQRHGAAGVQALVDPIVPEPAERSTYVLFSSLALIALFWFWQPMGGVVWNITAQCGCDTLYVVYAARLGAAAVRHFPHQSFRPLRSAPGLAAAAWAARTRRSISRPHGCIARCAIRSTWAGC